MEDRCSWPEEEGVDLYTEYRTAERKGERGEAQTEGRAIGRSWGSWPGPSWPWKQRGRSQFPELCRPKKLKIQPFYFYSKVPISVTR